MEAPELHCRQLQQLEGEITLCWKGSAGRPDFVFMAGLRFADLPAAKQFCNPDAAVR